MDIIFGIIYLLCITVIVIAGIYRIIYSCRNKKFKNKIKINNQKKDENSKKNDLSIEKLKQYALNIKNLKQYVINIKELEKKHPESIFKNKADYIYFTAIENIEILKYGDTEKLNIALKKCKNYELYDMQFVLENVQVYRIPFDKFLNKIPNIMVKTLTIIIGGAGGSIIVDDKFKYFFSYVKKILTLNEKTNEVFILSIIVVFLILIWGSTIYVNLVEIPRFKLNVKYVLFQIKKAIKEKEEEKNNKKSANNENINTIEIEMIEVIKVLEIDEREGVLKIKIESKEAPVNNTSAEKW